MQLIRTKGMWRVCDTNFIKDLSKTMDTFLLWSMYVKYINGICRFTKSSIYENIIVSEIETFYLDTILFFALHRSIALRKPSLGWSMKTESVFQLSAGRLDFDNLGDVFIYCFNIFYWRYYFHCIRGNTPIWLYT